MRLRAVQFTIAVLLSLPLLGGCAQTIHVPKLTFDRLETKILPGDPVFSGPGGAGPIFSMPSISSLGGSCGPCGTGNCCPPSRPLQPIDPFGWLQSGSAGSQVVDPIGWVFGL